MNSFRIEAPVRSFTGESVGVHFHKGTAHVDDGSKDGRAALEYFRRHGYGVFPADQDTEDATDATPADDATTEAMTNLGHGSSPSAGLGIGVPDTPAIPLAPPSGGAEYDPAKYNQDDVLAYLDSLADKDSDSQAEFDRIIAAERSGKKRKAILARGEQNQEAGK
ncbi:hypothetical protein [Streptomyces sp. NPDC004250]|uniref:hypothetical protein n=1 Tax=Streptomyces sp. NPDC004250 TaxID=3364692 RepID=UPI0036790B0B